MTCAVLTFTCQYRAPAAKRGDGHLHNHFAGQVLWKFPEGRCQSRSTAEYVWSVNQELCQEKTWEDVCKVPQPTGEHVLYALTDWCLDPQLCEHGSLQRQGEKLTQHM
ncbi:hypothetical protein JZ751_000090 [Albula glossodonta]|uniref:Uncharacterized protein n=1 Tax=Albula glossodonta TaxID=121402 RepID=A0A8T2PUT9_9TELE|nr:hypothetical protein JZ751_000090 [Albula glossodonta]